jgi:phosphopantothenoylcysteine decarboxylase/phosphopantothenate--cysteine ligase
MFSLTDESEMGHIELSREADLLVGTRRANILARMAAGLADDLAAVRRHRQPVLAAPR